METGKWMYDLATRLFPIGRSLTGAGVRESLEIIREYIPELQIKSIPSNTTVFDWTIPQEWEITEGYIEDEQGNHIIDYKDNNLCVVGYSISTDQVVELDELLQYVSVEENQPDVIPYVTSYYKPRFGFCMSKNLRDSLKPGKYHMVIKSRHFNGVLNYAELLLPGKSSKEVLLSTYICHPSMANNELSGPVLATALVKWLNSLDRNLTYRIVIVPETIGSISYLSKNLDIMKQNTIAGFVLSCVGDNRTYSYIETRNANTLADKVMQNVLSFYYPNYERYSFLQRGSDERQYNAPGVDLPVCGFCRSKYGEFPEYHTSADDLSVISPEGLQGAYEVMKQIIMALEYNKFYRVNCLCEPQLGKRGLYPTISRKGIYDEVRKLTNLIAYADGQNDLIDISNRIGVPISELLDSIDKLLEQGLLSGVDFYE